MQRSLVLSLILILLAAAPALASGPGIGDGKASDEHPALQRPGEEKVNWLSFEEAVAKMEREPRKIFMDVYTDWCGWCKRMDANTFSNPVVAKYLNETWYPVKFDGEEKDMVNYQGKEFRFIPNGRRGYNELTALLLNGRMSYPTTVYLDEKLDRIQAIPGYKDAVELDKILKFFGEDAYLSQTWTEFREDYVSPIGAAKP